MPRYDLDRDDYVKRMDRRVRWGWRVSTLRHRLPIGRGATIQAEAYDRNFDGDREAVTYHYAVRNDHMPDFERPTWINEKVRWQFLHHRNPLMALCADKVAVRNYLRFKGCKIAAPELFAVGATGRDLMSAPLPDRYVLKSTFGWKQIEFVDGSRPVPRKRLAAQVDAWNAWDHWRLLAELHYRDIAKRWYCEEHLGDGETMTEYKFYCIHGQPIFVLAIADRSATGFRCALFDLNWMPVGFHWSGHPTTLPELERPAGFELMVEEARRLSEDFMHVRVDFLKCARRLIFSELTFSGGGARNPFTPFMQNVVLGEMMDLRRSKEYIERADQIVSALHGVAVAA